MALTGKQTFVLRNIDRVRVRLPRSVHRDRYSLDNEDITIQVTFLRARKLVHQHENGALARIPR